MDVACHRRILTNQSALFQNYFIISTLKFPNMIGSSKSVFGNCVLCNRIESALLYLYNLMLWIQQYCTCTFWYYQYSNTIPIQSDTINTAILYQFNLILSIQQYYTNSISYYQYSITIPIQSDTINTVILYKFNLVLSIQQYYTNSIRCYQYSATTYKSCTLDSFPPFRSIHKTCVF